MIPFHIIYSWLFKSFRISGETELIDKLINDGYTRLMIVKRSWIFALFVLWIPIVILALSGISIYIAQQSITVEYIRYILIGGNVLISLILILSSWNYIRHFREIQSMAIISEDPVKLRDNLQRGDNYFISFFNASITNQFILILTIIGEIALVILYQEQLGSHFWILAGDTIVMIVEIIFLKMYRKRMMDLEMDYNIIVPGKVYFINQSGVLSSIQTIESDKIKTVRSSFPSKIASFFNYGTVDILTEGDTQAMMGTMTMYYVANPDEVVSNIQSLLDTKEKGRITPVELQENIAEIGAKEHSYDTRNKVRDVLR